MAMLTSRVGWLGPRSFATRTVFTLRAASDTLTTSCADHGAITVERTLDAPVSRVYEPAVGGIVGAIVAPPRLASLAVPVGAPGPLSRPDDGSPTSAGRAPSA